MASLFKKASTSEAPPPPPPPPVEAAGKVVSSSEKLIQERLAEWRDATAVAEDGMGMVTGVTKKMYMKAISKRMDSGELTRGVAIVFAYGTRLVDSEGTGPGTIYAQALAAKLEKAKIGSISRDTQSKEEREEWTPAPPKGCCGAGRSPTNALAEEIGKKNSDIKVVLVVVTPAMYQDRDCLDCIGAALKTKKMVVPIKFERHLPKPSNQKFGLGRDKASKKLRGVRSTVVDKLDAGPLGEPADLIKKVGAVYFTKQDTSVPKPKKEKKEKLLTDKELKKKELKDAKMAPKLEKKAKKQAAKPNKEDITVLQDRPEALQMIDQAYKHVELAIKSVKKDNDNPEDDAKAADTAQREALLAVKEKVTKRKMNWDMSEDGAWDGVILNHETGQVDALDLADSGLELDLGDLAPILSTLTVLNLHGNDKIIAPPVPRADVLLKAAYAKMKLRPQTEAFNTWKKEVTENGAKPFTKEGFKNPVKPSKKDLRTLQHLSKLENLQVVDLNYCRRITGFLNDIRKLENLIILDLSECGNITGSLRDLRMLKKLKHLDLKGMFQLTGQLDLMRPQDNSKKKTSKKKKLSKKQEEAEAEGAKQAAEELLDDQTHFRWAGFTDLAVLDLGSCDRIMGSLADVNQLSSLATLNVRNCETLGGDLKDLSSYNHPLPPDAGPKTMPVTGMKKLRILNVRQCKNVSGDLEDLDEESFPQLREIDINSCPNIKGNLHHLYFHQHLIKLDIFGCTDINGSLRDLSQAYFLKYLDAGSTFVDGDLKWLSELEFLDTLKLKDCLKISGSLKDIVHLKRLKKIDLTNNWQVTGVPRFQIERPDVALDINAGGQDDEQPEGAEA